MAKSNTCKEINIIYCFENLIKIWKKYREYFHLFLLLLCRSLYKNNKRLKMEQTCLVYIRKLWKLQSNNNNNKKTVSNNNKKVLCDKLNFTWKQRNTLYSLTFVESHRLQKKQTLNLCFCCCWCNSFIVVAPWLWNTFYNKFRKFVTISPIIVYSYFLWTVILLGFPFIVAESNEAFYWWHFIALVDSCLAIA